MTHQTPPGWHSDPGHTGDGPALQRWWDGSRWTDETRPAPPPHIPGPGAAWPPPEPKAPNRRARAAVAAAVAVAVLAAVGGGAYLLGSSDDSGNDRDAAGSSAAPSPDDGGGDGKGDGEGQEPKEPGGPGGESAAPEAPPAEDGFATDGAAGVSLPVLDGWTGKSGRVGATLSTGEHPCPGDAGESCQRGGVFSAPALALGSKATEAKAAAEADIAGNAKESYGGKSYGKITSHEQLKAEAVEVAGQKGFLVRWKVVTQKGDDGYVQSLAFPSPSVKGRLVIVRSGFDISDKAPGLPVMDKITDGIKAAKGTGNGQDV
ncbi:DUF2510 domain-containing protein [Streptomyces sp. A5-4]|uniref:DUF2510 domain-containing protein n=1 Tax=Streptomyces sp. A5-4 TaxID=3384771 RepID=UPI003DA8B8D3